jgi:hypothetical protein
MSGFPYTLQVDLRLGNPVGQALDFGADLWPCNLARERLHFCR